MMLSRSLSLFTSRRTNCLLPHLPILSRLPNPHLPFLTPSFSSDASDDHPLTITPTANSSASANLTANSSASAKPVGAGKYARLTATLIVLNSGCYVYCNVDLGLLLSSVPYLPPVSDWAILPTLPDLPTLSEVQNALPTVPEWVNKPIHSVQNLSSVLTGGAVAYTALSTRRDVKLDKEPQNKSDEGPHNKSDEGPQNKSDDNSGEVPRDDNSGEGPRNKKSGDGPHNSNKGPHKKSYKGGLFSMSMGTLLTFTTIISMLNGWE